MRRLVMGWALAAGLTWLGDAAGVPVVAAPATAREQFIEDARLRMTFVDRVVANAAVAFKSGDELRAYKTIRELRNLTYSVRSLQLPAALSDDAQAKALLGAVETAMAVLAGALDAALQFIDERKPSNAANLEERLERAANRAATARMLLKSYASKQP